MKEETPQGHQIQDEFILFKTKKSKKKYHSILSIV
jgi:hypothetical protein